MEITKLICDCCGMEIPTAKKQDIFGIEREYYRRGKLKLSYLSDSVDAAHILGIDLCEKCAENIRLEIEYNRLKLIEELHIRK